MWGDVLACFVVTARVRVRMEQWVAGAGREGSRLAIKEAWHERQRKRSTRQVPTTMAARLESIEIRKAIALHTRAITCSQVAGGHGNRNGVCRSTKTATWMTYRVLGKVGMYAHLRAFAQSRQSRAATQASSPNKGKKKQKTPACRAV
jgi:hypothetical protein